MKKMIAILLCLMMLLSCAAMAESIPAEKQSMGIVGINGAFELKCAIPEGYKLEVLANENNSLLAQVTSGEAGKPSIVLSIAYNDMYSDVERLNDVDEETLAAIAGTFSEEDSVEISNMTTAYGTKLFVVKEISDQVDYVDFYTIYKGYEVELFLSHAMFTADSGAEEAGILPVTEEEIQLAIQFLSDLDFVPDTAETTVQ